MRGTDSYNESLFGTVRLEEFVPQTHPLRPIRTWMNEALSNTLADLQGSYDVVDQFSYKYTHATRIDVHFLPADAQGKTQADLAIYDGERVQSFRLDECDYLATASHTTSPTATHHAHLNWSGASTEGTEAALCSF